MPEKPAANPTNSIILSNDKILITGSNGFIGSRVVANLLSKRFNNLRCFVRPSSNLAALEKIIKTYPEASVEIVKGNLLSSEDCKKATMDVVLAYHLAAGMEKTFPGCFMNSALATRNILSAAVENSDLRRFVNVSSFSVYSNLNIKRGGLLNESCDLETNFMERYDPYAFGKAKQEEIVLRYHYKHKIPYVIIRPGVVYGPGKFEINGRIGLGTFGIFLHLGGNNTIPFTYVDNCAEAIVLAGLHRAAENQVFNVVDDDPLSSRQFLKKYKQHKGYFFSIYIPYNIFYLLCYIWEKYAKWSSGQLPPLFNRRRCSTYWNGNSYSNAKLKDLIGWVPVVPSSEAYRCYFDSLKNTGRGNA